MQLALQEKAVKRLSIMSGKRVRHAAGLTAQQELPDLCCPLAGPQMHPAGLRSLIMVAYVG